MVHFRVFKCVQICFSGSRRRSWSSCRRGRRRAGCRWWGSGARSVWGCMRSHEVTKGQFRSPERRCTRRWRWDGGVTWSCWSPSSRSHCPGWRSPGHEVTWGHMKSHDVTLSWLQVIWTPDSYSICWYIYCWQLLQAKKQNYVQHFKLVFLRGKRVMSLYWLPTVFDINYVWDILEGPDTPLDQCVWTLAFTFTGHWSAKLSYTLTPCCSPLSIVVVSAGERQQPGNIL